MWKGKTDEAGGEIPDFSVVSWLLALTVGNCRFQGTGSPGLNEFSPVFYHYV